MAVWADELGPRPVKQEAAIVSLRDRHSQPASTRPAAESLVMQRESNQAHPQHGHNPEAEQHAVEVCLCNIQPLIQVFETNEANPTDGINGRGDRRSGEALEDQPSVIANRVYRLHTR